MPKIRIRNLQGHSKEDLRQKGAAAVFRAACSIRRSTAGRVKRTVIHLYVFVYVGFLWNMGPPWAPPGTPDSHHRFFKSQSFFDLDFWSIFGAKIGPKWSQIGSQNPSKIDQKSDWFFHRFLYAILIPKWSPKWLPKPSKINQKSIQNRIWPKKRDFLKNSTAPTREHHF